MGFELSADAQNVENVARQITKRIDALQGQVEAIRSKALADAEQLGLGKTAAIAAASKAANAKRSELVDSTKDERRESLRKFNKLLPSAQVRELFSSAVVVLMREQLGSERRSRLVEQLRAAGPRELQNAAKLAEVENDIELGAAVVSRIDSMPTKRRPFSAQNLAQKLVGSKFSEAKRAFDRIDLARLQVEDANRRFTTGRGDAHSKIAIGIRQRALAGDAS